MIPFWKQTVPLSFICVMGNVPMNYNSCLEFFSRLTRIWSPTLYWLLLRHMFLACYCDWSEIVCVVECVPSRQHAWCLRWHLGQILSASGMPVVLCYKMLGRQTWLRLGYLTMNQFGTAIKHNSLWKWVTSEPSFLGDICNSCSRFIGYLYHLKPACGRIYHC